MRLVFSRCFYSNYYSTVTYYSCSESVDTVMVLVEVRTYNLSAASSDLTTRQKHALNKYNEPLETKLTALSCCWQKSILSWKTFSMEKLLWKDWEMLIGVLELLVRLARCKLSISPSMKWSLVSRTLWWALTQLSHRYSWQSRQWEVAGLPSSQELHWGSERCWDLRRPPWWTTDEGRPFLPCSSAETTTSSRCWRESWRKAARPRLIPTETLFGRMWGIWASEGHLGSCGPPGIACKSVQTGQDVQPPGGWGRWGAGGLGGRGGGRWIGGDRSRAAAQLLAQRTCLQVGVWERRHLRRGPQNNFAHKDALRYTKSSEMVPWSNRANNADHRLACCIQRYLICAFPFNEFGLNWALCFCYYR